MKKTNPYVAISPIRVTFAIDAIQIDLLREILYGLLKLLHLSINQAYIRICYWIIRI